MVVVVVVTVMNSEGGKKVSGAKEGYRSLNGGVHALAWLTIIRAFFVFLLTTPNSLASQKNKNKNKNKNKQK